MNERFRTAREEVGSPTDPGVPLSRRELAELVRGWILENRGRQTAIDEVHIGKIERGEIRWPAADYRAALRAILGMRKDGDLGFSPRHGKRAARPIGQDPAQGATRILSPEVVGLDGLEAIELVRRAEATDVGPRTLAAIGEAVDGLCRAYTHMAPAETLSSMVGLQGVLGRLLDGRATLAQRRELMNAAGWLCLLAATADVDLAYERAAAANFAAAETMAAETGDPALAGAILETRAWNALSRDDLGTALQLCHAGLAVAPRTSPSYVQLCTQLARVAAKLGDARTVRDQVEECLSAVDRLPAADEAEHHFVCDRGRVAMHSAAALVWLGSETSMAEEYARQAVEQYESAASPSVHHLATARMNLALHLAQQDQPAEAAFLGGLAFQPSWRLCQTDLFLAGDLHRVLTGRYGNATPVREFHENYVAMCSTVLAATDPGSPLSGLPTNT